MSFETDLSQLHNRNQKLKKQKEDTANQPMESFSVVFCNKYVCGLVNDLINKSFFIFAGYRHACCSCGFKGLINGIDGNLHED